MARYEYDCEKCGPFEVTQKMSDPPLERHDCGERATRRISSTSFALKGSGWYADGYGGQGSGAKASAASSGGGCSPTGCAKPGCAAGDVN
jgi:putative FmdB family regulatory protein